MSDIYGLKLSNALTSATITDTAASGEIIDTQGFQSLTFAIKSEAITDGDSYTPSLEHGDEADLSDAAAVEGDLLGTIAAATFAATDDSSVKKLGYDCAGDGVKRYVRLVLTPAGATSGGVFSAIAIQGGARSAPVA